MISLGPCFPNVLGFRGLELLWNKSWRDCSVRAHAVLMYNLGSNSRIKVEKIKIKNVRLEREYSSVVKSA